MGPMDFGEKSIKNCVQERDGDAWPPGCVTEGPPGSTWVQWTLGRSRSRTAFKRGTGMLGHLVASQRGPLVRHGSNGLWGEVDQELRSREGRGCLATWLRHRGAPWFDMGPMDFGEKSIKNCVQERDGDAWPPGCVTEGGLDYCKLNGIRRTLALKDKNPNLKVLFSVGGWTAGGWIFSDMAQTRERR